jgi:hypothetical protein
MKQVNEPVNKTHYNPLERPTRYPLELSDNFHINLWSEDGTYKWTIAYFTKHSEGYYLEFVGDRPLDARVDWDHFKQCVKIGQIMLDNKFDDERSEK